MAISMNIGEAKTQLSRLVAAAVAGEDVVLSKAGAPQVRLVPVDETLERAADARAAKRRAAIGMYRHLVGGGEIDVRKIKAEDADYQSAIDRKYGRPD